MKNNYVRGTLEERFSAKVDKTSSSRGCWLWTAAKVSGGYGCIGVREGEKWRIEEAHKVSWQLFRGEIPEDMWVLHKCDVRNCVNPKHLFLGDRLANIHDAIDKGRLKLLPVRNGTYNHAAKLTDKEVDQIRALAKTGESQSSIGRRFGVTQPHVSDIVNGHARKTHSHVGQASGFQRTK